MRHFMVSAEACDGESVTFDPDDSRHLATVLRMRVGDEIVLSSDGRRFRCRLTSVTPSATTAERIEEIAPPRRETPVTLLQGVPKGKKMDDIVRMATEVGVDRIVPLMLTRCEGTASPSKLDRWKSIARSADKQSRSLRFTELTEPASLDTLPPNDGLKLLMWEGEAPSLKDVLADHPSPLHITLLIGPEGGIADDEYERLTKAGFLPVSLGPKIMRTETAGVAAIAVIHALLDS